MGVCCTLSRFALQALPTRPRPAAPRPPLTSPVAHDAGPWAHARRLPRHACPAGAKASEAPRDLPSRKRLASSASPPLQAGCDTLRLCSAICCWPRRRPRTPAARPAICRSPLRSGRQLGQERPEERRLACGWSNDLAVLAAPCAALPVSARLGNSSGFKPRWREKDEPLLRAGPPAASAAGCHAPGPDALLPSRGPEPPHPCGAAGSADAAAAAPPPVPRPVGASSPAGLVQPLPPEPELGTSCVVGSLPACSCARGRDSSPPRAAAAPPPPQDAPRAIAHLSHRREVDGKRHRQLGAAGRPRPLQLGRAADAHPSRSIDPPLRCHQQRYKALQQLRTLRMSMPLKPTLAAPSADEGTACCPAEPFEANSLLFKLASPYLPLLVDICGERAVPQAHTASCPAARTEPPFSEDLLVLLWERAPVSNALLPPTVCCPSLSALCARVQRSAVLGDGAAAWAPGMARDQRIAASLASSTAFALRRVCTGKATGGESAARTSEVGPRVGCPAASREARQQRGRRSLRHESLEPLPARQGCSRAVCRLLGRAGVGPGCCCCARKADGDGAPAAHPQGPWRQHQRGQRR